MRNGIALQVPRMLAAAAFAVSLAAGAANRDKVLHLATFDIETLDPHQFNDEPSLKVYSGGYGGTMTGYAELIQLYSPEPPTVNTTRFKLRAYDEAMEQYLRSATSEGQIVAARTMSELARNYMPILPAIFRLENNYVQPWVLGFSPPVFQSYWKYLDIDLAKRRQSANGQ